MSTRGHRAQGWAPQDQLLPVREGEQVGEIGLATSELGHLRWPIGQAVDAAQPLGEANDVEALIGTHVDQVTHERTRVSESL